MQPQQLGATRGYEFDALAQLGECRPDVPHQRLTLGAQTEVAAAALEQNDAEGLLHLTDCVADGTGRQMQFCCCGLKRTPTTRCFKYTELCHRYF